MNWTKTSKAFVTVLGCFITTLALGFLLKEQVLNRSTSWVVALGPTLAIIYGLSLIQPFLFVILSSLLALIVCTRLFLKLSGWKKFIILVIGILVWLLSGVIILMFAHGH